MSGPSFESCQEQCPYRESSEFFNIQTACKGLRAHLGEANFVADDDGNIVGECAKLICGSPATPDVDLPSISLQDWSDTSLNAFELLELWNQGLLPDQI